jgi:hypothetical protein
VKAIEPKKLELPVQADRAQVRMVHDVGEPFLQLREHPRLRRAQLPLRQDLGPPDAQHEKRRYDEAGDVDRDRVWSCNGGDQYARQPRASHLRGRDGHLELCVPVDELLAIDERGEIRLVGDVEEDGEDPDHELKDEQVPHAQRAGRPENRNRREQDGAGSVADDEDRPPAQAIDPDAGRQCEEDEGQEPDHAEEREGERARMEPDRGQPRDRELGDL